MTDEAIHDPDLQIDGDEDMIPDIPVEDVDPATDLGDARGSHGLARFAEEELLIGFATPHLRAGGSVSGLSDHHRHVARQRALQAAVLAYNHRDRIYYTQGASRWQSISRRLIAAKGQYATLYDCSSFGTWCLWNGLFVPFGVRDTVNAQRWLAGWTGTMFDHGKRVVHRENVRVGDLALYGSNPGRHVIICTGGGYGISMGSNIGPVKVDIDYRKDLSQIRRYI